MIGDIGLETAGRVNIDMYMGRLHAASRNIENTMS